MLLSSSSLDGSYAGIGTMQSDPAVCGLISDLLRRAELALNGDPVSTRQYVISALALLDGATDGLLGTREQSGVKSSGTGGLAKWQRNRIENFVAANLGKQIAIKDLAALVRLSPSYLCKVFKITFGMSPHSYVMMMRVSRAKSAMVSTRAALSDIAFGCGFSDQAHLCRVFRQIVGEAPHRWRQANQTDLGQ